MKNKIFCIVLYNLLSITSIIFTAEYEITKTEFSPNGLCKLYYQIQKNEESCENFICLKTLKLNKMINLYTDPHPTRGELTYIYFFTYDSKQTGFLISPQHIENIKKEAATIIPPQKQHSRIHGSSVIYKNNTPRPTLQPNWEIILKAGSFCTAFLVIAYYFSTKKL